MNVGDITAFLKLNTADYQAGLVGAGQQSTAFGKAQAKMWGAAQKAATIAMGAMIAAIGLGIKEAIAFEKQMSKVNTMLSKNSTVSLKTFAQGIRGLAKDFGQTTEALSNGLYDILSASVPAEEAMRVLEDASRAAVAGFTDTGIAADVLTTMMNAFGDATYDSAYAADILFATVVRGKTTFPELAGSIGNVATLASQAGMSMEELAASLAIMTRAGISTDIATTNLKGVIVALLKPTDELTEALDGMTLETDGFAAIMDHISDYPVDMLSRLFPNIRGLTGVITAAKGLGTEIEIINGIMEGGSPTQAAYNKASETTAFRMAQIKEEIKATAAEATERLLPTFEKLLQIGKKVVTFVFDFKEGIIAFLVIFKTVPLVLKFAQAAMTAFGSSATIALGPIGLITIAIAGIGAVIATVAAKRKTAAAEEEALHKEALGRVEALRLAGQAAAKERLTADEALALGEKIALDERAIKTQEKLVEARIAAYKIWNKQPAAAKAFRKPIVELLESQEKLARMELELARVRNENMLPASEALLAVTQEWINELWESSTAEERVALATDEHWLALVKQRDTMREVVGVVKERTEATEEGTEAEEEAGMTARQLHAYRKIMEQERLDLIEQNRRAFIEAEKEKGKALGSALTEMLDREKEFQAERVALAKATLEEWKADSVDFTGVAQSGFESLGSAMSSAFMDAAEAWGTAAGEGKDATEQWQTGIETFVEALLRALPQIMLTAGIQLLGMGPPLVFVGMGLIALSGIGAGIVAAMDAKSAKEVALTAAEAQEEAAAAQEKADVAALKHELWYDLLTDRNKALYNMNEQIKDYRAAGINEAAIALWEAKERASIDERYPAGMQFGGVVEGPAGIDTALIRATPGEFVMPVDQTRANLDILEAIRAGGSATPEINIEPMPVEITIDGRTIARAVIGFFGQETDIGGGRINTRVVRATE